MNFVKDCCGSYPLKSRSQNRSILSEWSQISAIVLSFETRSKLKDL
ncbi:hypothetical protein LEP1GSC060_0133 [Leptospira weilii serovar Ranarum str. ICFT]|uniref:Uncharacterized protein n=1 Tax=Leptospira weilii serovar Ranarum str. ICFT TaxID=1218598 RepID=N1WJM2_9LEPT|nr:hypothetical protein LEP1GSC060_0133 [Leptospira weilii serovar Ranarum str. ICFT]